MSLSVALMAVSFSLLLPSTKAEATPIRPDIRKILSQPTPSPNQFAPARAGWDGPEMPVRVDTLDTTYDQLGPAGTARQIHQALFAAFVPDFRALGAVVLVILLLRRIAAYRRKMLLATSVAAPSVPLTNAPATESTQHQRAA